MIKTKQIINIDKDGRPFIYADEKTVLFGSDEDQIEYSWDEITEVIRNDYDHFIKNRGI